MRRMRWGRDAVPHHGATHSTQRYAERATAAYTAMRRHFAAPHGLCYDTYPAARDGAPYTFAWPLTQVIGATLDLAGIASARERDVRDALQRLERYWDDRPSRGLPAYSATVRQARGRGGRYYHDDNAWAGLALMRAYDLLGDAWLLDRARAIFAFIVSGWADDAPNAAHAGGVYWLEQRRGETSRDRNTCSTAPSAELGMRLHLATGDAAPREWAERMYRWVDEHLRDPEDGLYWDHLCDVERGVWRLDTTKWSYNQGAMIGAAVLLSGAKGQGGGGYARRAEEVARTALRFYAGRYAMQDPAFNAIFCRNLLLLHRHTSDASLRAASLEAMRGYADWAWDTVRDPATDLFRFGGPDRPVKLIDQAATVEVLACLAWQPEHYDRLV